MNTFPGKNRIYLESFSFKEENGKNIELDIQDVHLDNLNLFIGNNAQGKSRLFRALQFVKGLYNYFYEPLAGQLKKISTNFHAEFVFKINDKKIKYSLDVMPSNEGNRYLEEVVGKEIIFLSTKENILYDENSKRKIDNFFIPPNVLAVASINDSRFKTIKLIREFFLRMLFIDASKMIQITIDPAASILNSLGANLSSVLSNWEKNFSHSYKETVHDFKRCFPIIENVKFIKEIIPTLGIETTLLAINEKEIDKDIGLTAWSDGFQRALCILCLPKSPFVFDGEVQGPSLICIDEIENGLDFNTLEFISDYLKSYSDHMQIALTSHSPLMGKFIHPKNWQIVKRKGAIIKISKPSVVEKDLEDKLELYREEYWDFYTHYVSQSDAYEPK